MFLDTNFLIDLGRELEGRRVGAARTFLGRHRSQVPSVSVISLGELAAGMEDNEAARGFVERFRVVPLKPEIALTAAEVDRQLIEIGQRLGENDNWLAGFARYYGVPLVSNDAAFDRVPGLRRLAY
jgi:predicted nucleic acid-binding protein